jgi:hypothetical protein
MVEYFVELLGTLLYVLGTGALAIAGVIAEQSGMQFVTAGDPILGVWLIGVGLIALYAGYFLATDKLLPRLRTVTA